MTLHDEIAKMTCMQVNIAIDNRLDKEIGLNYPDYCHDWSKAGELLDDLIDNAENDVIISHWVYANQETGEMYPAYSVQKGSIVQRGHTLKEAIARCWLEWYEVNKC